MGAVNRQQGLAVVEFTLLLPILLILLLGLTELGRALYQYSQLEKISRDTARFVVEGAASGTTGLLQLTPDVVAEASALAVNGDGNSQPLLPGLTAADVTITSLGGAMVKVEIRYRFSPMLFGDTLRLPLFGLADDISLQFDLVSSSVMRAL